MYLSAHDAYYTSSLFNFQSESPNFHTLISTSLFLFILVTAGFKYLGEIKEMHMRNIIQETLYITCYSKVVFKKGDSGC